MIPLSRDVFHKANCDDGCRDLADMLGWKVRTTHTNVTMFVHLMNCEILLYIGRAGGDGGKGACKAR